jgi:hypothetical protein
MKFAAYMPCFVYHILSYSFGSILYHCTYGCVFCMLLFNFVNYALLLLCLCIVIVMFMYCYCYVYVLLLLCLCIIFVTFMYSYCYVCSVLGILFHCVVLCIVCV